MQGYGFAPPSVRQEITFFADSGVQVTSSRFVVYGQMYPMQGITSVSPFTIPARRFWPIFGACIFGFFSLGGVFAAFSEGNPVGLIISGGLMALCIWRALAAKAIHGVFISTAGMQMRALSSPNLAFVQQVVGALHQSIASR